MSTSTNGRQGPFDDVLDAEIDDWVAAHLAASPEWDEERWAALGELLGVEFSAARPA